MNFISNFFNRQITTPVLREDLAEIAGYLMKDPEDHSNESIARGWNEIAEWLRIGFDCESDKGELYHALHQSLKMIASNIKSAPEEAEKIDIQKEYLEAVKSSYGQLQQAAYYLEAMAHLKATTPPTIIEDRKGNKLSVPPIQIYNRPNEDHDLMGVILENIERKLDNYFSKTEIKSASARSLKGFNPPVR
jgi:hypothetical protein